MSLLLLPLTASLLLLLPSQASAAWCLFNPCVNVPGVGMIKGSTDSAFFSGRQFYEYYGIPYAEPTSGNNRYFVFQFVIVYKKKSKGILTFERSS